ncbi:MAG TPA: hypothetical protein VJ733_06820 [Candidatus Binatia bacterium]|nr:hypothetical protein [Candidatus Binatia bacterium]
MNFFLAVAITVSLVFSTTARSDVSGQRRTAGVLDKFEARVGFEIYRAFPGDRQEFRLGLAKKTPFVFYGDKGMEFTPVECKNSAHFSMISYANDRGPFSVGDCKEHKESIRTLMKSAEAGLKTILIALRKSGPEITDEKLRQVGWVYERTTLADGSELHYFPVLLIGHGVLAVPTVVLLDDQSTLVIQVSVTGLCDSGGLESHRLCKNTRQSLKDLAMQLHNSLMQEGQPAP